MNGWRVQALVLAAVVGASGNAAAQATVEPDALKSPACLAARARLDALMAEKMPDAALLRAARQGAARACFRAAADAERPSRLERPSIALPPVASPSPAQPVAPTPPTIVAPPAPRPAQIGRCDSGGCYDGNGQRLNRAGSQLVNPQGRLCTQQGTVLNCP